MLLRRTPLVDYWQGRTFLGILYVAVGTALLIADIVFWRAVFRPVDAPEGFSGEHTGQS